MRSSSMSGETQLRPIRVFIEFRPIIAKVIYRITVSARHEALLCLPHSVKATSFFSQLKNMCYFGFLRKCTYFQFVNFLRYQISILLDLKNS